MTRIQIHLILINKIKDIDSFLLEAKANECEYLQEYLSKEYGIYSSLEYIRDILILKEYEKDFNYFFKEMNMIRKEKDNIERNYKDYLFWKDINDYERLEDVKKIFQDIIKKYEKLFNDLFLSIVYKGESCRGFIKEITGEGSTEEIFLIKEQPIDTCPMINEILEDLSDRESIDRLENFRELCSEIRGNINHWKDELWKNAELKVSQEGEIILEFKEIPYLNTDVFVEKELLVFKNICNNLQAISEWGNEYFSFVISNKIFKLNIN